MAPNATLGFVPQTSTHFQSLPWRSSGVYDAVMIPLPSVNFREFHEALVRDCQESSPNSVRVGSFRRFCSVGYGNLRPPEQAKVAPTLLQYVVVDQCWYLLGDHNTKTVPINRQGFLSILEGMHEYSATHYLRHWGNVISSADKYFSQYLSDALPPTPDQTNIFTATTNPSAVLAGPQTIDPSLLQLLHITGSAGAQDATTANPSTYTASSVQAQNMARYLFKRVTSTQVKSIVTTIISNFEIAALYLAYMLQGKKDFPETMAKLEDELEFTGYNPFADKDGRSRLHELRAPLRMAHTTSPLCLLFPKKLYSRPPSQQNMFEAWYTSGNTRPRALKMVEQCIMEVVFKLATTKDNTFIVLSELLSDLRNHLPVEAEAEYDFFFRSHDIESSQMQVDLNGQPPRGSTSGEADCGDNAGRKGAANGGTQSPPKNTSVGLADRNGSPDSSSDGRLSQDDRQSRPPSPTNTQPPHSFVNRASSLPPPPIPAHIFNRTSSLPPSPLPSHDRRNLRPLEPTPTETRSDASKDARSLPTPGYPHFDIYPPLDRYHGSQSQSPSSEADTTTGGQNVDKDPIPEPNANSHVQRTTGQSEMNDSDDEPPDQRGPEEDHRPASPSPSLSDEDDEILPKKKSRKKNSNTDPLLKAQQLSEFQFRGIFDLADFLRPADITLPRVTIPCTPPPTIEGNRPLDLPVPGCDCVPGGECIHGSDCRRFEWLPIFHHGQDVNLVTTLFETARIHGETATSIETLNIRSTSAKEIHHTLRGGNVLLLGYETADLGFDELGARDLRSLSRCCMLQDFLLPPDAKSRVVLGTPKDVLQAGQTSFLRGLCSSAIPLSYDFEDVQLYDSSQLAWNCFSAPPGRYDSQPYPIPELKRGFISSGSTFECMSRTSFGFATAIVPRMGVLICFIAVPKTDSFRIPGAFPLPFDTNKWDVDVTLVKPGSRLLLQPDTRYMLLAPKETISIQSYFYAMPCMMNTLKAIYASFVHGEIHYPTSGSLPGVSLLGRITTFIHQYYVLNAEQQDLTAEELANLPDLGTEEGVLSLISLGHFWEVGGCLQKWCYSPPTQLEERLRMIACRKRMRYIIDWFFAHFELIGHDGRLLDPRDEVFEPWLGNMAGALWIERKHAEAKGTTAICSSDQLRLALERTFAMEKNVLTHFTRCIRFGKAASLEWTGPRFLVKRKLTPSMSARPIYGVTCDDIEKGIPSDCPDTITVPAKYRGRKRKRVHQS